MKNDPSDNRRRLTAIIEHDRRGLTRFVQSRLFGEGRDEADDIVSDVVLRLFERADLLAQVEDVTAYLYRALAHAVTDMFRRRRAGPLRPAPEPPDRDEPEGADPAPDPEVALAQREQRERIGQALSRLTPAERAVWVAVEIEGWRFRELAERWNEPLGTLLSRKNRAAKKLRALLEGESR
ncbi:RNA polymerase sigma factor [Telmatospirillum siberiense]|uniref:RNA polymerase subunit sigma-24 n=1 Tax=Telmatospirillum siberiense TaxID=382514 RepID=A0A2N3PQY6_9PROT|nr:RNA polymerase sigma factor [Telmatospirillum siberiense]PKU22806.1 RNA polymerase subunit sigma-24 [Telmatospirillum siberiense]